MNNQEVDFIGKYQVLEPLAKGSMGQVYKAREPEVGILVAIKVLSQFSSSSEDLANESLQRFKIESSSTQRLAHPNIVSILEAGRSDLGLPYLVMEYIDGESVASKLEHQGSLDPLTSLHYLAQVASALDYANENNIIHRDVKPSNIIINPFDHAYVIDFGIAKMSDTSLTPAGTVMGSPSYMSPEQVRGLELDGSTDVFSLAITAYEMFTGIRPFPGRDFTTVVSNILNREPLSFADTGAVLPTELERVFGKALSKEKKDRFQSATELVQALSDSLGVAVDDKGLVGGLPASDGVLKSSLSPTVEIPAEVSEALRLRDAEHDRQEELARLEDEVLANKENNERPVASAVPVSDDLSLLNKKIVSGSTPIKLICVGGFSLGILSMLAYQIWSQEIDKVSLKDSVVPIQSSELATISKGLASDASRQKIEDLSTIEIIRVLEQGNQQSEVKKLLIAEIGSREADSVFINVLLEALEDPEFSIRIAAIKALGEEEYLLKPEVLSSVGRRLKDDDPLVRGFAVKTLGSLQSQEARGLLQQSAETEDSEMVLELLRAAIAEDAEAT